MANEDSACSCAGRRAVHVMRDALPGAPTIPLAEHGARCKHHTATCIVMPQQTTGHTHGSGLLWFACLWSACLMLRVG